MASDAEVKSYEVAYLISPEVAEDDVYGQAGQITAAIQDAQGLVGRIEEPRKRRLAYPIQKFDEAYFGWTTFSLAPERVSEIEKKLKLEKPILRYLIVEEVRRPVIVPRPYPPRRPRRAPALRLQPPAAFTPQPPKEEDKAKLEELDKKLEEILGK